MNTATVLFLVSMSLITYLMAIVRGMRYVRRQWRMGLPAPGWVILGGVFAVAIIVFLCYVLVGFWRDAGISDTATTLSLLLYFLGAIVMNGLISILGKGGEQ